MLWDRTNRPVWLRYAVAVLAVVIAAGIRLQFLEVLELRAAFLTFYPAVAIAALYGGLGSGLLATVVSAALADYFWMEPVGSFAITNSADLISMVVFLSSGALISAIAEATHRAQARANKAEEQAKLAAERKQAEVLLQCQAELLHLSYDAIIVWQLGGCIKNWNKGAEELYGYSQKEALGQVTHDLLKTIHSEPWTQIEAKLRERKFWEGELKHRTREGREIIVSARHQLVRGADGVERVLETNRDITERKQTEEAIKQSQRTFAKLIERSPFGTYVVDSQFCIAMMNVASQEGAFRNVRPVIGRDFSEAMRILWPEPVAAEIIGYFRHTLDTGEPYYSPRFINPRHDVEIIESYEWELHRMTLPDGQYGVICYYYDSTKLREAEAAVRQSEERFRSIAENQSEGLMLFDPQGNLIYQNPASLRIHGFSVQEDGRIAHEDLPATWQAWDDQGRPITFNEWPVSRVFRGEQFQNQMLRVLRPETGLEFNASYNGCPICDDAGKLVLSFITIRDITNQREAEEALKNSEGRLNLALKAAQDGVWDWNMETNEVWYSPRYKEMLGYSEDEIEHHVNAWLRLLHPEDKEPSLQLVDAVMRGEQDYEIEFRLRHKNGHYLDILSRGHPVRRESDGKIVRIVGTHFDLTERKRAEDALRESEAKLQAALASIPDAVFISDAEGRLVNFNDGFVTYHRFRSRDECSKKITECPTYLDAYMADGHPAPLEMWAIPRALRGETVNNTLYTLRCKDTGEIWTGSYSFSPIRYKDDVIIGAVVVARDITEQKQMQEELRKSRDELELRVQERTAELERSNQALEEFASIASHDMKEPLRKVISFGNMIHRQCKDSLGETGNDYLKRMLDATQRMQTMITSLLEYSRVTSNAEPFSEVDLYDIVHEVLSDLEIQIAKTGGEAKIVELPLVEADPAQMRQLFQNLIGNALKFHKDGEKPLVHIWSTPTESGTQIFIEDNGIGFEEQFLDRIFQLFHRLHGRSSQYEGTGMGLAICKKIVERHGGRITAKSTPGEGATFIINLPRNIKDTGTTCRETTISAWK